jgi:hypothetical protein
MITERDKSRKSRHYSEDSTTLENIRKSRKLHGVGSGGSLASIMAEKVKRMSVSSQNDSELDRDELQGDEDYPFYSTRNISRNSTTRQKPNKSIISDAIQNVRSSQMARESSTQNHTGVRRQSLAHRLTTMVDGEKNNNMSAGISLQIQQWKTVAEFEEDEKNKFQLFNDLKMKSKILVLLSVVSAIFSIIEIELTHWSKQSSVQSSLDFGTPLCWRNVDHLSNQDILQHVSLLFNVSHDTRLTQLLSDKINFGSKYEVLLEAIKPWQVYRTTKNFTVDEPFFSILLVIRSIIFVINIFVIVFLWQYYDKLLRLYITRNSCRKVVRCYRRQCLEIFTEELYSAHFVYHPYQINGG